MTQRYFRFLLLFLACLPVWTAAATKPAGIYADTVLVHGKVLTVDASDSVAAALAIRNGKILAVGTDEAVMALADAHTQIIDLRGRTATPGLIDSHAHIADGGVAELYGTELKDARSVAEIVTRVKAAVAKLKQGEWLQGSGWDEGKLAEHRYVFAADLDAVAPNNPVWLNHTTGHYGVANGYALKLAKVTDTSIDPTAGTIDRDARGAPSGVLKEAAMEAVTDLIPAPTAKQRRAGILHMLKTLHSEGMTAVKDPSITAPTWTAYRELLERGQLSAHICTLWYAGVTLESARAALKLIQAQPKPPQSLGDGNLLSCGAKIFMDGSGTARTAWVYKEWHRRSTEVDPDNFGYPTVDPEVYRQQIRLFHDAGVHVGTHAVGDRAIDWAVDTYAEVLKETPTRGLRHSIIHGNIPTDHAIEVMADLQKNYDAGYLELQAPFIWWIGDNYAGTYGPDRVGRLVPLRTLQARGVHWAGGSDYDVTPLPARYGLWASVARETLLGTYGPHPFGVTEATDVHTALRSYTGWAARQLFLEDKIGSLEVGKDADIAVWTQDPYSMPSAELKELHCELTLFRGKVVYRAAATSGATTLKH